LPEGMAVFLGSVKVFPSHIYVTITVTICFLFCVSSLAAHNMFQVCMDSFFSIYQNLGLPTRPLSISC
jgi:hypothetical protein